MDYGLNLSGGLLMISCWTSLFILSAYCFLRILSPKKEPDQLAHRNGREFWRTRIGLILAVAGNAIGLGNFLRFPVKAAANGGGAFMIPYLLALVLLGIPLMWVEWTMGRYGGVRGHSTMPGMLALMWRNPASKYLGALGIALPFTVVIYYVFIESWTLAFAWFSATGKYLGSTSREAMGHFLRGFQGVEANQFFSTLTPALIFVGITLALNFYFLYRGISKGIEVLSKIGIPILFLFGFILMIRVITMGTPDPAHPDWNIGNGVAFMWNPDFSRLNEANVWLAAAGQIFFTLGLGFGIIHTYASYISEKDDIPLNGLTTSSTNEVAEVILGGTLAIPAAVAFFGLAETRIIAQEGAFNLGFQSLPVIFQKIPLGMFFGAMWFMLLFIAGITSSAALAQPAIAFLEDEFKWKRPKAVVVFFSVLTPGTLMVVFLFRFGILDELDFWAGTLGLVLLGTIEMIVFSWIFGIEKGWQEIHKGADIQIPRIFKFILKYVTPLYLLILLVLWIYQDAIGRFWMKGVPETHHPYLWGARVLFLSIMAVTIILVGVAWHRKRSDGAARYP
jgi:NSS family neurotransmitter:Na+ symporter